MGVAFSFLCEFTLHSWDYSKHFELPPFLYKILTFHASRGAGSEAHCNSMSFAPTGAPEARFHEKGSYRRKVITTFLKL